MSVFDNLKGHMITGWTLSNDDETLEVTAVKKLRTYKFKYETRNDCCNHVWFESVEGETGGDVVLTEAKDWEDLETNDCDVLEAGVWTLTTTRGYIDIEVRNSHNGFYGGSIEFLGMEEVPRA